MTTSVFRSLPSTPEETSVPEVQPEFKPNIVAPEQGGSVEEPIDDPDAPYAVLKALGIEDRLENMDSDSRDNLKEVKDYVGLLIKERGLKPFQNTYNQVMEELRWDMGIDENTEVSVVLDRIGGVVKAWRELTFIRNPREKRALFMKLARQPDSQSMHKIVFEEMNRHKVWL